MGDELKVEPSRTRTLALFLFLALAFLAFAGCGADAWDVTTSHGGPENPNTTLDGTWTWKPDAWDEPAALDGLRPGD